MSDFQSAATWLNRFDKSNMNDATRFLVDKFREASESGDDPDQKARVVEAAAKASKNPSATAEALILIAEERFQAGHFLPALSGLKNAVAVYETLESQKKSSSALHRLWVARWLYGWAAWKMQLNYTAYETWRRAKDDLEKLIQNSVDEGEAEKVKWYQETQTNNEAAFACRAEEAFTWLYNFPQKRVMVRKPSGKKSVDKLTAVEDVESELNIIGASKMREDLVRLRNKIVTEIKRAEENQLQPEQEKAGDFGVVRQHVQELLESLEQRSDLDERAEALLECGLAMHQTRDNRQAALFMEQAVSNYLPGCHQRAVARWMLGIMQTQPDSGSTRGFDSFRKAMNEMGELKQRAEVANNKTLVDWYTNKLATLAKAVELTKGRMQAE